MAKKNINKRGSLFKQTPSEFNKKKTKYRNMTVGEYEIKLIEAFKGIEAYDTLVLMACGLAVVIALLSQVATIRHESAFRRNIDTTDTFRFWKARFFRVDATLYTVAAMAISASLSYSTASNFDQLEMELIATADAFTRHVPFIKSLNEKNYGRWRDGVISRLLGIINSCPATNIALFNFDPAQIAKMDTQQVIKFLGFSNPPEPETVLRYIASVIFSEGSPKDITFDETPLSQESSMSIIERELSAVMGIAFDRVPTEYDATAFNGSSTKLNVIPRKTMEQYLSPLEMVIYQNAISTNNRTKVRALEDKVKQLMGNLGQVGPKSNSVLIDTGETVWALSPSLAAIQRVGPPVGVEPDQTGNEENASAPAPVEPLAPPKELPKVRGTKSVSPNTAKKPEAEGGAA